MAKLTGYNIRVCMAVMIATFSHGFGAGSFATSTGQPGFYDYFNMDVTSLHTANILSAANGLFFFGCAVGGFLQSWLSDRIGRIGSFAASAVLSVIGGALVAGSVNIPMLLVFRTIQGVGLGAFLALVPMYLTEVAPPRHRGLLTGLTQTGTGLGYITCAWLSLGTYYAKNLTLSWRLPLALAVVAPLALLSVLYFVPETPRYLIWKGEREKALAILKKLHHDPTHTSDADVMAEFTQIVRQVEVEKEDSPSYYQMFKKPSWRRRSLLTMWLLFFQQASGIYGIVNFFPLLLGSLGMSPSMSLILFGVFQITATVSIICAIAVLDRFGRRTLLLFGFASVACVLLAETVLQWKFQGTNDRAGNAACIFFIFLFVVAFQGIDAPSFVWASEVFPTNLRAKGVSLAVFAYFAGTITFSTPAPVALNSIKWGMFLIYCIICICSFFVVYFFIPETKGLPVEEIGALFHDPVAVHMTADGEGIVEDKERVDMVEDANKLGGKQGPEEVVIAEKV